GYKILRRTRKERAVAPVLFLDERLADTGTIIGEIVMRRIEGVERIKAGALEVRKTIGKHIEGIYDLHRPQLRACARGDRRNFAFGVNDEHRPVERNHIVYDNAGSFAGPAGAYGDRM